MVGMPPYPRGRYSVDTEEHELWRCREFSESKAGEVDGCWDLPATGVNAGEGATLDELVMSTSGEQAFEAEAWPE